MNKRETKLVSTKDWDQWLAIVKTKATAWKIWHLIDPSIPEKPQKFEEPAEPEYSQPLLNNAEEINAATALYKSQIEVYKMANKKYLRQEEAFANTITHIYDTASAAYTSQLGKLEVHPWVLLRALQSRIAPTDAGRRLEFQHWYKKLSTGPSQKQDVDAWLDEWISMYYLAKDVGIAEVKDSQRAFSDFIKIVGEIAPVIAQFYTRIIDKPGTDHEKELFNLIDEFRYDIKARHLTKLTVSHAAFSADEGEEKDKPNKPKGPSFREPGPCVCNGKTKHWFVDCWYLCHIYGRNHPKKPSNWKPNEATLKKIKEKLESKPELKKKVDRSFERNKEKEQDQKDDKKDKGDQINCAVFPGSFATDSYLRSSWILDGGSAINICNETMAHRFVKERDCTDGSYIIAGPGRMPIVAYGRISLTVNTPTGTKQLNISEVTYIPDFMTNLISSTYLEDKGLWHDPEHQRLHRKGETIIKCIRNSGHYLLEDNTDGDGDVAPATFAATKVGTTHDWHQLLAHAADDAIQHLAQAAEGVEISDHAKVPPTNKCETCALSKAHQIISRSSRKSEDSDKPFFRVTYDLIPMTTALNKHEYVSHLACAKTDFHLVYTHRHKSEALSCLKRGIKIIETRYNGKVVFIRSDGERALGKEFTDLLTELGITWEPSAPATSEQNGHSERLGHILVIKARAMAIASGLPDYLWPWIFQTAGMIMNRTPKKKLGWKTAFEIVTGFLPYLGHLRVYGCKAYALNKHIARLEKLRPRAHIGFLVGYDSTNVFNIWIPSQRKIIRVRDVTFDEEAFYEPGEIDAAQLEKEPFLYDTFDVSHHDGPRITELSDSEDSEDDDLVIVQKPDESAPQTPDGTKDKAMPGAFDDFDDQPREPTPGSSTPAPAKKPRAPKKPELSEDNILPSRTRTQRTMTAKGEDSAKKKKKQAARPQAHAALLQQAMEGAPQAFHAAFGVFAAARTYYEAEDSPPPPTKELLPGTRYHRDQLPPEPKFWHHMMKHPLKEGFLEAVQTEIKALQSKGTWKEVPASHANEANKVSIPTTWVFKYKFDDHGYLTKLKARLCARGDLQNTEQNTYAATLAIRIFRTMMAIVAYFNLETRQYDAVNAFANSDIDEATYIQPPQGWKGTSGILFLLLRALYGLKQSPALWFQHLSSSLAELGFQRIPGTECLFLHEHMMLFFFVDDIAVIYEARYTKEVEEFQMKLFKKYEMRYLGEVSWFLGIRITRNRSTRQLRLCQDSYIDKITSKYNIHLGGRKPIAPMISGETLVKNSEQATAQQILAYQQIVGSINFAAVTTRADISFAASKLSEFLTNPSERHQAAAVRVMQYLAHTKFYSIVYDAMATDPHTTFIASSDASFADDPATRFSSQGYGFKLFNGLIDWKASKQKTVTMSSTEAELLAATAAAREFIWWKRFFEEITLDLGCQPYIEVDNLQTIRIIKSDNSQFTSKLRHVDIHHHWLRQETRSGNVSVRYQASAKILADGLTKALPGLRHKEFLKLLGLQNEPPNKDLNSHSNAASKINDSAAGSPPISAHEAQNDEEELEGGDA